MPDSMRPRDDDGFIAGVHFAGDEDSAYQLEQWLRPLDGLNAHLRDEFGVPQPLGILCRSADHALAISEHTTLPVRFSRLFSGLTTFMSQPELRVVFYVNQSMKNFQALRFSGPAHVHLNHGESEKASMISNQLKAYDWVFTAGTAARERILGELIGMPETRMMDIGRPQLDEPRSVPSAWSDSSAAREQGPVVFVAPTWEGDSPEMAYGTVALSGMKLLMSLFDAGFRVIYRPHPRTGVVSPAARHARQECERLVNARANGFLDTSDGVSWQLDVADAAVCEMSSVAVDWLSTGRPLIMLRPADPRAEVIDGGLFDRARSLEPHDAARAGVDLRDALAHTEDACALADELASHYLGPTGPGQQQSRFEDAAVWAVRLRTERKA
ncbi:putative integral membrane protein [Brevibacterium yomogidense]|uniref:Putative integral membrane protein n=1 Tax=Brevibacterium yomogidense TaxID=946573 RepID=A0A1X6X7V9_9MICO|nr:putative integral membrane protein [Brevibacterium yomogidense]